MNNYYFIDTHCHIHDNEFVKKYEKSADEIIKDAEMAGIKKLVCVGTDLKSSIEAVEFCKNRDNCFPTIALHPHEAAKYSIDELNEQLEKLEELLSKNKHIIAIGECGLDYFYHDDKKTHEKQLQILKKHMKMAKINNLPVIFHVRDAGNDKSKNKRAFTEFFDVYDEFKGLTGVVHSFTADKLTAEELIKRGLYIGLNGIITFAKEVQQEVARTIPLKNLVLETDAPFLTPQPFRGKMCEPKHLRVTAEFLSGLRGKNVDKIAKATSKNAEKLFSI